MFAKRLKEEELEGHEVPALLRGRNHPFSTASSRVVNSKIPYTLTLSLPFPVVRNQDLDHTIKPRHWTRPKARPSIGWEHDSGTRKAARAGLPMLGRVV